MLTDLIDFLRARIDEDERIAREAARIDGDRWSAAGPMSEPDRVEGCTGWGAVGYDMVEPAAHHVASHVADRPGHGEWPCTTVRALAAMYADRPGWREEWR